MVLNLPSDSETAEACEHWHKPRRFELDVTAIEYLHAQFMQQRASAGDKTKHKPFRIPRPTTDAQEIKRFFQRAGGGGK